MDTQVKFACTDHLVSKESFDIIPFEKGIFRTHPVPENLGRYYESEDYISHTDAGNGLQDKVYQVVKSYMLSAKASWIRKYIRQGNIMDFGAGTGEFLNKMKSFLWNVDGVEPNEKARKLAIFKNIDLKADLKLIGRKKYDVISLWHVLEHLPDLDEKLNSFNNLLVENGLLVIAVPNFNSYDSNYYKNDWAAWDVPRHLWHFSRKGIQSKLKEHGFSLLEEKALPFDSYYVSLLSEKNKTGKKNIFNAVYRGWLSNFKARSTGEYSSIAYFFRKD
ncbi:class I SAM-dependent methyltransferase [Christiangramia salexigens]|uniref:Methyltransferase n=1 Tax=Christiangramia salexigens TaxID=1913577 RepID=A0A1L3J6R7_9FLAO|nr:class I SAM-dependent methyltransferase [Christiangramia salexigens]APG60800.1 methyltransferase [Christiangramia salexigens]